MYLNRRYGILDISLEKTYRGMPPVASLLYSSETPCKLNWQDNWTTLQGSSIDDEVLEIAAALLTAELISLEKRCELLCTCVRSQRVTILVP